MKLKPHTSNFNMLFIASIALISLSCYGQEPLNFKGPNKDSELIYEDQNRKRISRKIVDVSKNSYFYQQGHNKIEVVAGIIPIRPSKDSGISDSERDKASNFFPISIGKSASFKYYGYTVGRWYENVKIVANKIEEISFLDKKINSILISYETSAPGWYERKGECWYSVEHGICIKENYKVYSKRNPAASGEFSIKLTEISSNNTAN